MKSRIISKIRTFAIEHPALMTYGIAFAITIAVGVATGLLDNQQAFANLNRCIGCEDV